MPLVASTVKLIVRAIDMLWPMDHEPPIVTPFMAEREAPLIDGIARVLEKRNPRKGGILAFLRMVDWVKVVQLVIACLAYVQADPGGLTASTFGRLDPEDIEAIKQEFSR